MQEERREGTGSEQTLAVTVNISKHLLYNIIPVVRHRLSLLGSEYEERSLGGSMTIYGPYKEGFEGLYRKQDTGEK